jgi:hypothetical protein
MNRAAIIRGLATAPRRGPHGFTAHAGSGWTVIDPATFTGAELGFEWLDEADRAALFGTFDHAVGDLRAAGLDAQRVGARGERTAFSGLVNRPEQRDHVAWSTERIREATLALLDDLKTDNPDPTRN